MCHSMTVRGGRDVRVCEREHHNMFAPNTSLNIMYMCLPSCLSSPHIDLRGQFVIMLQLGSLPFCSAHLHLTIALLALPLPSSPHSHPHPPHSTPPLALFQAAHCTKGRPLSAMLQPAFNSEGVSHDEVVRAYV
jgi:hypothetical protein